MGNWGKRTISRCLVFATITMLGFGLQSNAEAFWSPHLTVATDSVNRGLSETSGKASVAIGLDWSGQRWFTGGRLSNSQLPQPINPDNRSGQTVALYGGYVWPINTTWSGQWLLNRYQFTGALDTIDGYNEFAISFNNEHWGVEFAVADDAWGEPGLTRYAAVNWQRPLRRWSNRTTIDVALGYANTERSLTWTYHYLELGASYAYQQWLLDARLHLIDNQRVNRRGWSAPKARLVASLSFQF